MPDQKLDYLILGPAPPFRGGIAETQYELAIHLEREGKKIHLFSFSKLYPKLLFPGKAQKTKEIIGSAPFTITSALHAFNPLKWRKVVQQINELNPKYLIFRYYTPFLAPLYGWIAKRVNQEILKIALVDNWITHIHQMH